MDAAGREPGNRAPGRRAAWVAAGLALATAAAGLEMLGRAGRTVGPARAVAASPEVMVVGGGSEALTLWRGRGLRGRVLVHAGRFLHFVSPDEDLGLMARALTGSGTGPRLDEAYAERADWRSYLWAAAELRIARRIVYLEPPQVLRARLADLGRRGPAGDPADLSVADLPREARTTLPSVLEPILLDVHASWFETDDGGALLAALRRSSLTTDLVTANLSRDSPDVSPEARARLAAFAEALRRGPGAPP